MERRSTNGPAVLALGGAGGKSHDASDGDRGQRLGARRAEAEALEAIQQDFPDAPAGLEGEANFNTELHGLYAQRPGAAEEGTAVAWAAGGSGVAVGSDVYHREFASLAHEKEKERLHSQFMADRAAARERPALQRLQTQESLREQLRERDDSLLHTDHAAGVQALDAAAEARWEAREMRHTVRDAQETMAQSRLNTNDVRPARAPVRPQALDPTRLMQRAATDGAWLAQENERSASLREAVPQRHVVPHRDHFNDTAHRDAYRGTAGPRLAPRTAARLVPVAAASGGGGGDADDQVLDVPAPVAAPRWMRQMPRSSRPHVTAGENDHDSDRDDAIARQALPVRPTGFGVAVPASARAAATDPFRREDDGAPEDDSTPPATSRAPPPVAPAWLHRVAASADMPGADADDDVDVDAHTEAQTRARCATTTAGAAKLLAPHARPSAADDADRWAAPVDGGDEVSPPSATPFVRRVKHAAALVRSSDAADPFADKELAADLDAAADTRRKHRGPTAVMKARPGAVQQPTDPHTRDAADTSAPPAAGTAPWRRGTAHRPGWRPLQRRGLPVAADLADDGPDAHGSDGNGPGPRRASTTAGAPQIPVVGRSAVSQDTLRENEPGNDGDAAAQPRGRASAAPRGAGPRAVRAPLDLVAEDNDEDDDDDVGLPPRANATAPGAQQAAVPRTQLAQDPTLRDADGADDAVGGSGRTTVGRRVPPGQAFLPPVALGALDNDDGGDDDIAATTPARFRNGKAAGGRFTTAAAFRGPDAYGADAAGLDVDLEGSGTSSRVPGAPPGQRPQGRATQRLGRTAASAQDALQVARADDDGTGLNLAEDAADADATDPHGVRGQRHSHRAGQHGLVRSAATTAANVRRGVAAHRESHLPSHETMYDIALESQGEQSLAARWQALA